MASLPLENDRNSPRKSAPRGGRPAPVVHNAEISVLPSASALNTDLLADWAELARVAAEPNPFFESWFLTPGLAQWGKNIVLACVRAGDRLIGVLPMKHSGSYYGYPVPHLSTWLHPNAFCGVPLVARGFEAQFWQSLLRWADDRAGSALFLHLPDLPKDGPLYRALVEVAQADTRPATIVQSEERALLQSDASPEAYFEASMSGKKRKELRRQERRLSEEGTLAFTRQTDSDDVENWTAVFLALEKSGWKGQEGSALACDPATECLFREALSGAAEANRLERLTLTLDGQPIAMLANFITAPGAYSFKTAFDEAYSRFSPGVLLQRENLDLLARDGIEWCDSCAAADHPMIERIWREKRSMVKISIGIGGKMRRMLFRKFLRAECGSNIEELAL